MPLPVLRQFRHFPRVAGGDGVREAAATGRHRAFLADPKAYAPGTVMFAGAPDPADRKAIIDYLKSAK